MKGSLLIRNIHTMVTMDASSPVVRGGCVYAVDGKIVHAGARPAR